MYRGQRITIRTNNGKTIKGRYKTTVGSNIVVTTDGDRFQKDKTTITHRFS